MVPSSPSRESLSVLGGIDGVAATSGRPSLANNPKRLDDKENGATAGRPYTITRVSI
jgi:hypothetical protein